MRGKVLSLLPSVAYYAESRTAPQKGTDELGGPYMILGIERDKHHKPTRLNIACVYRVYESGISITAIYILII